MTAHPATVYCHLARPIVVGQNSDMSTQIYLDRFADCLNRERTTYERM